jgi:CBS domain-containing protein
MQLSNDVQKIAARGSWFACRRTEAGEALMRPRQVRQIMKRTAPVVARPDETVRDAAVRMTEEACGSILVCDGDRLLGIFTERDLMTRVVSQDLDPKATRLTQVMTPNPDRIESTETAREAMRRMDEFGYRHLPVTEKGRVVGVISIRDLPFETIARMQPELDQRHAVAERLW